MSDSPKLLSKRARKWSLWVHALSSSLWMGSALAMMVLILAKGSVPDDAAQLHAFCLCVKLIDDWIIIGSCGVQQLPRYQAVERNVTILGSVQLCILAFVLYASIFKPWGKLRPARD
jgi:hypothetical protein